jgi:predicted NACHT family NTPase
MAKRSLKASQAGISQAKRAFDRRGWTQEYLAAEVGLQTRQSVWKFFSGRPVERHIFIDICFTLDLDWEDIVDRSAFISDSPEPQGVTDPAAESADHPIPSDDFVAAKNHVKALTHAQCQSLELPLDLHQPITLTQLYTEAYLRPYQGLGMSGSVAKILAQEAIQPHSRVLIVGGPGAGKTTLLQHLALEISNERLPGQGQISLPVFLRLRQLALVPTAELDVQQYLNQRWLASGLSQPLVDQLWQQGQLWLLLDGWDELPGEQHRIVTQQIQTLLDTYAGLRVLLSGRGGGPLPQFSGLVTLELTDFAPQQVTSFVHKWFVASQPVQGKTLAETFLATLNHPDNDRLREMALTPILLHLMCLVFHRFGDFPEQRSKLYQQALDLLLGQWDQQRGIRRHQPLEHLSAIDLTEILCAVATHSFEQGRAVLEAPELLGHIAHSLPHRADQADTLEQQWADSRAILQVLIEHYGMLTARELGSYAFAHLSFQEYLTARRWALKGLERHHPEDWDDLASHLGEPRWQDVILLTVEMVPQAEALWISLQRQSQRYVAAHPELLALLDWADHQAALASGDYHPAAVRSFYLGLWLGQSLDLATALDARLALDLPADLSLDETLIRLLHQSRQWLEKPTLQAGFDLAGAMDLHQRFALGDALGNTLQQLQTQVLDALETPADLSRWGEEHGTGWLRTLQQAVTDDRQWQIDSHDLSNHGALQQYYQMQRLLVDCLRHNRRFSAATVKAFEHSLLGQEVQYEPA